MNLVLTFDYELFGDGSGDVFEQMITPTDRILHICETQSIKTTLFFEVLEYLELKKEWDKGNSMGYTSDPIIAIEEQVQRVAKEGHDIQLHLHPQWINAKWTESGWKLNMNNWRLGDFNTSNYSIEKLIVESKEVLENLIRTVKPDYKCTIFRAGAFNIMPSEEVYAAMKKAGLKADSSVYPGGYEHGQLSKFDYRDVSLYKDYWWSDSNDIRKPTDKNREVMEIPVFAIPQRRIQKLLNKDKVKSLIFGGKSKVSSVSQEKISNRSFFDKIQYLFEKEAFTWDFCLFSPHLHKSFFHYIEENLSDHRSTYIIIGHPKSLQSDRSLKSLIDLANRNGYTFKTLKEVYETFSRDVV